MNDNTIDNDAILVDHSMSDDIFDMIEQALCRPEAIVYFAFLAVGILCLARIFFMLDKTWKIFAIFVLIFCAIILFASRLS